MIRWVVVVETGIGSPVCAVMGYDLLRQGDGVGYVALMVSVVSQLAFALLIAVWVADAALDGTAPSSTSSSAHQPKE